MEFHKVYMKFDVALPFALRRESGLATCDSMSFAGPFDFLDAGLGLRSLSE